MLPGLRHGSVGSPKDHDERSAPFGVIQRVAERIAQLRHPVAHRLRMHVQCLRYGIAGAGVREPCEQCDGQPFPGRFW